MIKKVIRGIHTSVVFIPLFICFTAGTVPAQSPAAELVYTATEIEIGNGKMRVTNSFDLLINHRSADYLSEIEVPFSGINKLVSMDASLHSPDGSLIRKLSRKEIIEQHNISDISMFEDEYIKKFTLRHSHFPYRIKWAYTTETSEFITICHWIPVIGSNIPTRKAKLKIISPADYQFNIGVSGVKVMTDAIVDKQRVREWECTFQNVYEEEVNQENPYELMPYVWAVPIHFRFDREGSSKGWTEFGKWVNDLNDQLHWLPEMEKEKVAAVLGQYGSTRDQVRELYYYVQDRTRYINVSLETGGFKPYPASYVSKYGYGDCKALSIYMKALLDQAGIACHYVLVRAGTIEKDLNPAFVASQFNHAVVLVPLENDSLWLDCTSDNPLGYTGSFIHDRKALVIGDSGGSLARIPALSKEQVRRTRNGLVKFTSGNTVELQMRVFASGREAERIRSMQKNLSARELMSNVADLVNPDSFSADSVQLTNGNRDDFRYVVDYSGRSVNLVRQYGNELIVPVIPVEMPYLVAPGQRITTMKLPYAVVSSDTLKYILPPGFHATGIPDSRVEKSSQGEYSISFFLSGDELTMIRYLEIKAGLFSGDEYAGLYSFLRRIRKIEASGTVSLIKS